MLTPDIRNEIVRDLVPTMYAHTPSGKPSKDFCTKVAKMLVSNYPFLKDVGATASGYVRFICGACQTRITLSYGIIIIS